VVRGALWDSTQAGPRTVNTLLDMGFDVTVLCWNINGDLPEHESNGEYEIHRYQRTIPAGSIKYFLCWPLWWIWLFRQYLAGSYAIIHAMNVDSVFPGILTKLFSKTKVVFDVRDAWGMCLTAKPWPFPQLFRIFEKINARFADAILLSQGAVDVCADYFGKSAARQTFAIQVLNVPEQDVPFEPREAGALPLKINFSGRLSGLRAAFKLADAVENNEKLEIDVYGKLSDPKIRERYLELSNATFDGRVSHQESLQRMDNADLISMVYNPSMDVVFIASANKMFEAMMLRKPYICTRGSYPARLAEEHQLGWSVDYNDQSELVALLNHLADNPAEVKLAGKNGRDAYEKHYTWAVQKKSLITLYQHLMGDQQHETKLYQGWHQFLGAPSHPNSTNASQK